MKTKVHILYDRRQTTPDETRGLRVVLVRLDTNFVVLPVMRIAVFTEEIATSINYTPPMYKNGPQRVELLEQNLEDWQAVELVRTDFLRSFEELQDRPPLTKDDHSLDAMF